MKILVVVNMQFAASHRWQKAPAHVSFLQNYHRHVFTVRAVKEVSHVEREIEILTLKSVLEKWCAKQVRNNSWTEASCETIALNMLDYFDLDECEVLEDGENGAIVRK